MHNRGPVGPVRRREETAQVQGLTRPLASNRHARALKRLKEILAQLPGFGDSSAGR
jgi:hypothetical protein